MFTNRTTVFRLPHALFWQTLLYLYLLFVVPAFVVIFAEHLSVELSFIKGFKSLVFYVLVLLLVLVGLRSIVAFSYLLSFLNTLAIGPSSDVLAVCLSLFHWGTQSLHPLQQTVSRNLFTEAFSSERQPPLFYDGCEGPDSTATLSMTNLVTTDLEGQYTIHPTLVLEFVGIRAAASTFPLSVRTLSYVFFS